MAIVFSLKIMKVISLVLFLTVFSAGDSVGTFKSISDGTTSVSKAGNFEIGFFSPGNSGDRYVGIWYKNTSPVAVVWVANRCNPIKDSSGLLTILNAGSLMILYQNKSVIWSTRRFKEAQKPVVELLDSGNLVVREEEYENSENYLWQSFDYPSDTLLPGMKLGWDLRTDLERNISAWNNQHDPCPGDFSYGIEFNEKDRSFPESIARKGNKKFYRPGPWNGLRFSGSSDLRPNKLFDHDFVNNYDEVYYTYHLKNESVISRIVINQASLMQQLWSEEERTWMIYSSMPKDDCDDYGLCGANGNCIINQNPVCQCLVGFKPKSPEKWGLMDWSEGCILNNTPSCKHKDKDLFVKFSNLKLPDSSKTFMADNFDLEQCKAICLSKCSCMAYSNTNISGQGSGCVIWYGDLIDIRQFSSGGQDLFIRVPHSEPEQNGQDDHKTKTVILVAVIGGASGMLLLGYFILRRGVKGGNNKATPGNRVKQVDLELPLFNLATINAGTDNFSVNNKLGEGGFGPVYRGKLEDGQEITVKRLSLSSRQGTNEFKNEVILITKLQHRNLVKLLGCCIEGEEKLLIYEYMPNKSLDFFIFDQHRSKLLEWPNRFQIIYGIARGLQYLHQDSRLRIVHRDLKISNILLDKEMNPKISDFGMAKTFGGDQTEGSTNRITGTQ